MTTAIVNDGGVRHIEYLPPNKLEVVLKLQYVNQPFGILCVWFGKSSVALLLLRLMENTSKWRKLFLWINIVLYFAISIASLATTYAQCSPTRALWEPQLRKTGQASCWNPKITSDIDIAQGGKLSQLSLRSKREFLLTEVLYEAYGAYLDFALAFMPITIVWEMNVSLRKKLGLCCLLGLGVLYVSFDMVCCCANDKKLSAGICASVKTSYFPSLIDTKDPTWGSYPLYLWAVLELEAVIIAGCVPPSVPLWDFLTRGKPMTGNSSSGYRSSQRSFKLLRTSKKGKSVDAPSSNQANVSLTQSQAGSNYDMENHGHTNGREGSFTRERKPNEVV